MSFPPIEFVRPSAGPGEAGPACAAAFAFEGPDLTPAAKALDEEVAGAIGRALGLGRFQGRSEQVLNLLAPSPDLDQAVLVGIGPAGAGPDPLAVEAGAALAYQAAAGSGARSLEIRATELTPELAAHAAYGVALGAYRFDRYRTREPAETKPAVSAVRIVSHQPKTADAAFDALRPVAEAVHFTRDLVSEPPNVLFPAEFARRLAALEDLGVEVEVLGEAELERLGMGALLGVGRGSARETQLAVLRWMGGSAEQPPVAFVGKGVCFDTGGITLKPGAGMESMKWDMAGAAAVAGLFHALAGRRSRANAVGVLGLVENMPDGAAQRPGDIVTSLSGQTIEIISTDAEGRLVLADALWYCQERFKPSAMVDLATLTGAAKTALGSEFSALMSNDDRLAERLLSAATLEGEPLWRLPLPAKHAKGLESLAADMKNHADSSGGGGSITGGLFLQRFVNGCSWAHLDIVPTAWKAPSTQPTVPEGATGYGVRLLNRFVAEFLEPAQSA